jgi:hypothetical protein
MITYLDPRGEPSTPVTPYQLPWPEQQQTEPRTIGLFANGFPDSVNFLEHVQVALAALLPAQSSFILVNKGNASAVATTDQLDRFTGTVDAVVAAYGH